MREDLLVLGVGSNLGNRALYIKDAIARLKSNDIFCLDGEREIETLIETDLKISSVYENKAILPENRDDTDESWDLNYYNIVIAGRSKLDHLDILDRVKQIEKEQGRKSKDRWAPREIDIDILIYGNREVNTESLIIPHLAVFQRHSTIFPLNEILPELYIESRRQKIKDIFKENYSNMKQFIYRVFELQDI